MSEEKVTSKSNIVTMPDGTQVNFGAKGSLSSAMDLDTATITFNIVTGNMVNWVVSPLVEGLNDFQRKVMMYGLLEKVKSTLSGVAKDDLEEAIGSNIKAIEEGTFNLRSTGASTAVVGLTMIMKAYALAKSKQQEAFAHWGNLEDSAVIAEVFEDWSAKSTSEKNATRKNPYVGLELNLLKMAAEPDAASAL